MLVNLSQQQLATLLQGELRQPTSQLINSVTLSAQASQVGRAFFALAGQRYHGHNFVSQALANKASLAVVEEFQPSSLAQLKVTSTQEALTQLAAYNRQLFTQPVIAITGNSGKTTVKEILAAFLEAHFIQQAKPVAAVKSPHKLTQVLATRGNLNNHLGVPLTLLELQPQHQTAVVELGANHLGEIDQLAQLVQPQLGLITNVTSAHLGEFGSRKNIAKAKGELISQLAADGLLVLNADDEFFSYWQELAVQRKDLRLLTFGLEQPAAVSLKNLQILSKSKHQPTSWSFTLISPWGEQEFTSQLLGKHNLANALAAISLASALGVELSLQAEVLASLQPVAGRLSLVAGVQGASILDDTYNASPDAVKAAIDVLANFSGKKLLALGNLAELGAATDLIHQELGEYAAQLNIDAVYCLEGAAALTAEAFYALKPDALPKFAQGQVTAASPQALAELILPELDAETCLLVKGSRSAKMEQLVEQLHVK